MLLNGLGRRPGVLDQSTQGWAGKYTLCFAEHEAASPWEPLHVSRGFRATQSAVTVFTAESGHNVLVTIFDPELDPDGRMARELTDVLVAVLK